MTNTPPSLHRLHECVSHDSIVLDTVKLLVRAGARAELRAVREHADEGPLKREYESLGDALQPRLDLERAEPAQ